MTAMDKAKITAEELAARLREAAGRAAGRRDHDDGNLGGGNQAGGKQAGRDRAGPPADGLKQAVQKVRDAFGR